MAKQKEVNKRKNKIGIFIIGNAIIWGLVIIATSQVLKGTGYMDKLIPILGGGAGLSVVLLGGGLLGKK